MTFRILTASLTVMALVAAPAAAAPTAQAQSQSKPDPKPEPKAEPKADSSIVGKWSMNIETPGGARPATLDLKLDGKKVGGTISSEVGETPITGEFAEGKLMFSITIDANGQSLSIGFTGAAQKDGSLAGTANMAGQDMNWTATRIKEK